MALQVRTPLGWRSNPASGPPNLVVFQSLLIPAADAAEKTVLACSMPSLNQGERRELGSCPRRGDQRKGEGFKSRSGLSGFSGNASSKIPSRPEPIHHLPERLLCSSALPPGALPE